MMPAALRQYAPSRVMHWPTAVEYVTSRPPGGEVSTSPDAGQVRTIPGGQWLLTVLSLKVSPALCSCGATGCLATEASGGAIVRILKERGIPAETTKDAVRLIQDGNAEAIALSRRAGHLLGEVLATSLALLNPAVLVLGGAIPAACPTFVQAVRESIFERSVPMATRELNITMSAIGADACLQGARHMVMTQAFSAAAVDARLAAS